MKAHRFVVRARNKQISVPEAQAEVYRLNWACSRFLEMLTTDFLERVTSLQLLEIPEPLKNRNRQLIQDNNEDALTRGGRLTTACTRPDSAWMSSDRLKACYIVYVRVMPGVGRLRVIIR